MLLLKNVLKCLMENKTKQFFCITWENKLIFINEKYLRTPEPIHSIHHDGLLTHISGFKMSFITDANSHRGQRERMIALLSNQREPEWTR